MPYTGLVLVQIVYLSTSLYYLHLGIYLPTHMYSKYIGAVGLAGPTAADVAPPQSLL